MPACHTCGNDYDKAFTVRTHDGSSFTFDSVECMAHELAPRCAVCDVRILGHGLEADDRMYCCDHCAQRDGVTELRDRVHANGHN